MNFGGGRIIENANNELKNSIDTILNLSNNNTTIINELIKNMQIKIINNIYNAEIRQRGLETYWLNYVSRAVLNLDQNNFDAMLYLALYGYHDLIDHNKVTKDTFNFLIDKLLIDCKTNKTNKDKLLFAVNHGLLSFFTPTSLEYENKLDQDILLEALKYDVSNLTNTYYNNPNKKLSEFRHEIIAKVRRIDPNYQPPPLDSKVNNSHSQETKKCFVATAAFGSCLAPEVIFFKKYRDERLSLTPWGNRLISIYYRHSPPIAAFIDKSALLKKIARACLTPIIFLIKISTGYKPS